MKFSNTLKPCLITLLMAVHHWASADVEVNVIEYLGWSQSVELRNGSTRVVVVPAIGRIMHYGYADEENLIYTNKDFHGQQLEVGEIYMKDGQPAHAFFGGDRALPTAEDRIEYVRGNRRLPDHWIDGSPYSFELLDDGVAITSPTSQLLGVQMTRIIRLDHQSPKLTIDQRLKKRQPAATSELGNIPLTIWNLTPIIPPKQTWQPLPDDSVFESRIFVPKWSTKRIIGHYAIEDNLVRLTPQNKNGQKIGTDSRGWVAGWTGSIVMVESFTYLNGEIYPEGGTSAAVYSNPRFAELECLSPERKLSVGESIQLTIHWDLYRIDNETAVIAFLNSLPLTPSAYASEE